MTQKNPMQISARMDEIDAVLETESVPSYSEMWAANAELREAWEYYHTPRCAHPNAPGFMTMRSLTQIIGYDAYHKAEAFLTQSILAVAGSAAGSKWMSDDLLARAASAAPVAPPPVPCAGRIQAIHANV